MLVCSSYQEPRISAEAEGVAPSVVFDRRLPPAPSPPTHSRLPPDGHEFPVSYSDSTTCDKPSRFTTPRSHSRSRSRDGREATSTTSSYGGAEGSASLNRTSSLSSRWRRQDEKSEKSVRDKIAMFSQNKRAKKSDVSDYFDDKTDGGMRGFSETDISTRGGSPSPCLSKTSTFSSMINVSSNNPDTGTKVKAAASEVDVCRTGRETERTIPTPSRIDVCQADCSQGLHSRSQSLVDIERTHHIKRHSVSTIERPNEKLEDKERRCSVTTKAELRRKSLSKLRGLVIPESITNEASSKPPIDLPRIGSSPPPLPTATPVSVTQKTLSLPRDVNRTQKIYKTDSISSIESCESNASKQSSTIGSSQSWRSHISTSTSSKYSPAIKRKFPAISRPDSLPPVSCRNTRSCSPAADCIMSPFKSSDGLITPNSDLSFEIDCKQSNNRNSSSSKSVFDSRLNRSEDSDNDSAVSSTLSSFSQGMTPPASPVPGGSDPEEAKSSKLHTIPRHSSQSSMDEMDTKRVLKTGTIEAENRRNVIKSAKCSSGRSSDDSTPELARKCSSKKDENFALRLETDLRDGTVRPGLRKQSASETRRSTNDCLPENEVFYGPTGEKDKIRVEQVYIDKAGDMYKESEIKVAYLNEVSDSFEHELTDIPSTDVPSDVVAEVPLKRFHQEFKLPMSSDRWAQLEQKYGNNSDDFEAKVGKRRPPDKPEPTVQRTINNARKISVTQNVHSGGGGGGFKALAEKWKQRAEVEDDGQSSPRLASPIGSSAKTVEEVPSTSREQRPNSLPIVRADVPDRKFSMPEFGNAGIRMRERRSEGNGGSTDMPSRPSSLIESTSEPVKNLENDPAYLSQSGTTASSSTDSLDGQGSISRTVSKEVLEAFSKGRTLGQFVSVGSRFSMNSSNTPRVSDITKAFEGRSTGISSHIRMFSVDSVASDDGSAGGHYGSVTSLASGTRDQYGSISSLASSTSIISSQELAQLIEEANQSLEEHIR
ncbi:uncharacterized protein LOC125177659 [Hyalella azteca]|uniref:Uncharacterized protein LOC125177659 n=1 Tax=Hyalella azteca TaxID=294128 RepID=A0A979FGQ1_HYAAZ|nr:uncharacterized protein LOC125177659 [Hyalella azteca]